MSERKRFRTKIESSFDRLTIYQYWLQGWSNGMILNEMRKIHEESKRLHAPISPKTIQRDLRTAKDEIFNADTFNLPFELKKKYDEYELMKKELWRIIGEGIKATSVTGKRETKVIKGKQEKVVVPQIQQDTIYKNGGLAPYFAQLRGVIKDQAKLIGLVDSGSLTVNILQQVFGGGESKDSQDENGMFAKLSYDKKERIMEIMMEENDDRIEEAEIIE